MEHPVPFGHMSMAAAAAAYHRRVQPQENAEGGLSERLGEPVMREWSEAQVLEWISSIELPDGCAEAVLLVFTDFNGKDLLELNSKMLQKMLRLAGVAEPAQVATAIMRQRDLGSATLAAGATGPRDAAECPLCMEVYDEELRVPRILQCGHSACQGCYARLLRPITARGNVKKLECPTCRKVTEVQRGKAANLQKNFSLLC